MNKTRHVKSNKKGFTLVELLVAMAISGIVAGAIFTAFQSQQKSYLIQDQVTEMQQNLRAGMDLMVREIRMAGYDPTGDASTQIENAEPDLIYLTKDDDSGEHIVFDSYTSNGIKKLGRTTSNSTITVTESPAGSGHFESHNPSPGPYHQPLAENIEAMGFAYAFDADGDGDLDTYNAGGNQVVIWAFDSDGDNDLDRNLDADGDGNITAADGPGPGGNGLIPGQALPTPDVAPQDIRAVRIWILAKTRLGDRNFLNTNTYVVGYKVISPNTDADPNNNNRRMRLLETEVKCRNLEFN